MTDNISSARGRQVKPTKSEIKKYWRTLKEKADSGDVQAIVEMIRLMEDEK